MITFDTRGIAQIWHPLTFSMQAFQDTLVATYLSERFRKVPNVSHSFRKKINTEALSQKFQVSACTIPLIKEREKVPLANNMEA